MNKVNITYKETEKRIKLMVDKIKKKKSIKDLYGIPRGGLYIALRLSHLTGLPITDDPKPNSTLILDDCIDSGATQESFKNFKHFMVLVNKQKEEIDEWLVFFWEFK